MASYFCWMPSVLPRKHHPLSLVASFVIHLLALLLALINLSNTYLSHNSDITVQITTPSNTISETADLSSAIVSQTSSTTQSSISHHKMTVPVEWSRIHKPQLDDRNYLHLTLPNKLQVLLVSDPHTDKASAALDVHVGHLCDPDDVPGLAHFCEHLLFMGTKKYPIENEYSQFLSKHSGHSNAFTSTENTNYYFEIAAEHLYGALDRFAQFFIEPLFDDSCTDREMNAVDSEHKKNLQSDNWRIYQLEKDLSNPEHPYRKFGTGNLITLKDEPKRKGLDIRQILLDFHAKYYSANIMRLVILGKEPLSTLKDWAIDLFSLIPNNNTPVPSFDDHPFTEKELLKVVKIKPVKDIKNLEIMFPIPDTIPDYKYQPSRYLSHLIGHEGEGSLLSFLKTKGLATSLHAGASRGATNFGFFRVGIDLTDRGVLEYEKVVIYVFQYIKMIKQAGVQKWIHDECAKTYEMMFRFKEKSSPSGFTSRTAGQMQLYEIPDILSGPYLISEFSEEKIICLFDLLEPENSRITLVSQHIEADDLNIAEHYGTEYKIDSFSSQLLHDIRESAPIPELHLPHPNPFIPESFDVDKSHDKQDFAKIIINDDHVRVWHKKDDTFFVPKANCWFNLISPIVYTSPRQSIVSRMFVELIKDSMMEYSYDAEVAGLSYSLEASVDGILLSIEGYNDKIHVLLKTILEKIKDFKTNIDRFLLVKESLSRTYKNWFMEAPHQHAIFQLTLLTQERLWSAQDKLNVFESIRPENIDSFVKELLSYLNAEILIHGNLPIDKALDIGNSVKNILGYDPLPINQRFPSMRTQLFADGQHLIFNRFGYNKDNLNSAIEYYLQIGDYEDDILRAQLDLFSQIVSEPCFDQLRTKEQLGYMVFSGTRKQTGMIGFRVLIQSEKHPLYLEWRIEEFLLKMRHHIEEMSDGEFSSHANALAIKLTEKDKILAQESKKLWSHINSRYIDFRQAKREADLVTSFNKSDLLKFFDHYISLSSKNRKKISSHMISQKVLPIEEDFSLPIGSILSKNVVIESDEEVYELKSRLPLSKAAVPKYPLSSYA